MLETGTQSRPLKASRRPFTYTHTRRLLTRHAHGKDLHVSNVRPFNIYKPPWQGVHCLFMNPCMQ